MSELQNKYMCQIVFHNLNKKCEIECFTEQVLSYIGHLFSQMPFDFLRVPFMLCYKEPEQTLDTKYAFFLYAEKSFNTGVSFSVLTEILKILRFSADLLGSLFETFGG